MVRVRTLRADCEERIDALEGLLKGEIDEVLTDNDLSQRRPGSGVKYPDCVWHRIVCSYTVVEIKSSSIGKALRQLEAFARHFPEIHLRVEKYIIEVGRVTRELKKYGIRLRLVSKRLGLYQPLRVLGTRKVQLDIDGKPLFIWVVRRKR